MPSRYDIAKGKTPKKEAPKKDRVKTVSKQYTKENARNWGEIVRSLSPEARAILENPPSLLPRSSLSPEAQALIESYDPSAFLPRSEEERTTQNIAGPQRAPVPNEFFIRTRNGQEIRIHANSFNASFMADFDGSMVQVDMSFRLTMEESRLLMDGFQDR